LDSYFEKEKVVKEAKVVKTVKEKVVKEKVVKEAKRGRPKNPEKEVEANETENLFQALIREQQKEDELAVGWMSNPEQNVEPIPDTKDVEPIPDTKETAKKEKEERSEMSTADKESKKMNKDEAKSAEKMAKEAAKEQEKEAKAAEKLAKEAAKAAEKLSKDSAKEHDKKMKELVLAEAKAAKEAAKNTEKKTEKKTDNKSDKKSDKKTDKKSESDMVSPEKKEATKKRLQKNAADTEYQTNMNELSAQLESAPGNRIVTSNTAVESAQAPAQESAAPVEKTVKAKKFIHNGVKYMRDKENGDLYNDEAELIGRWNEEKQEIEFLEMDEELEEEEEEEK